MRLVCGLVLCVLLFLVVTLWYGLLFVGLVGWCVVRKCRCIGLVRWRVMVLLVMVRRRLRRVLVFIRVRRRVLLIMVLSGRLLVM